MTNEELFRQELINALRRELVGPDLPTPNPAAAGNGGHPQTEVLQESPTQRYVAGVLFPASQPINELEDTSEKDTDAAADDVGEDPEIHVEEQSDEVTRDGRMNDQLADAYDETIRMANEFFPSAMGITFLTEYPEDGLVIAAQAAVYQSQAPADPKSKLREWHRTELDIKPVSLRMHADIAHELQEFDLVDHLRLRTISHRRDDGTFLVTVSLLNMKASSKSGPPSGSDCFFQVGFRVADPKQRFLFKEYRTARKIFGERTEDPDQHEEAVLELLYRNRKAYAVGHGCAADRGDESEGHTNEVKTSTVPQFKVPPIEPRTDGGEELSMYSLSGAGGTEKCEHVPTILEQLAKDYEQWIDDRDTEIRGLPNDLQQTGKENLNACRQCLSRIQAGITLLRSDEKLRMAFMLANRGMLMQQYHSRRDRRAVDGQWEDIPTDYKPTEPEHGRWRSFQLAFILMNMTSLVRTGEQDHDDRNHVDLIWFPTGGGKTEAYLGLAACDIFYRRLTRPSNGGCTVLMRYTLRLLTSQQFQRASSMICACEIIRREDHERLGEEPISIGLWVGESLTPTKRSQATRALNDLVNKRNQADNPFQLLKCPWCGTALDDRDGVLGYVAHGRPKTIIFLCPDTRCPFSKRSQSLPVKVIDEDIYDTPPTLIIGTVDKFAMLAWREQAGRIFGLGTDTECDPPDLIIQDELHLISGPLGSVVGLYESAIDLLCTWKGRRPKIVASTATIRRAWHQCEALYDRPVFQFPPQGLEISDSFFAKENPDAPGRVYVGVFASAAPSFVTAMVRALSALFQSCRSIALPSGAPESVRDPYWTVLQYFNSLRELGHAATLVEADIPEYMWAIASRSKLPKELCRSIGSPVELTSRRTADEIPEILERLTVRYPRTSDDGPRPLDTLLATNMISVGVDVDRLGLMVVVGQPKTTSEYIQASSRVGRSRSAPGLVVTMYNPGKPRDRSHYEHFRAYHAAFYKYVEPTSVTPYSLPVLERALHAVLVTLARHCAKVYSPDAIDPDEATITKLLDFLEARCQNVDGEHAPVLIDKLRRLLKEWSDIRPKEWGRFGSPPPSRPLMYPAGTEPLEEWDDSAWPTPSSMRNVDVECDAKVVSTYETIE